MLCERWKKNKNQTKVLVCELGGKDVRWLFGGGRSFLERCDFSSALLRRGQSPGGAVTHTVSRRFCSHPAAAPFRSQGRPNPDGPSSFPDCHHVHGCPCSAVSLVFGLTLGRWYGVVFLWLLAVGVLCCPTEFCARTSGNAG